MTAKDQYKNLFSMTAKATKYQITANKFVVLFPVLVHQLLTDGWFDRSTKWVPIFSIEVLGPFINRTSFFKSEFYPVERWLRSARLKIPFKILPKIYSKFNFSRSNKFGQRNFHFVIIGFPI